MEQISPLLSPRSDHDLHIPRASENWKLILRLVRRSALVRAAMTMMATRV